MAMTNFNDYANRFKHIKMRREDGILELQFHSAGKELKWSAIPDKEIGDCFTDIRADSDNRCIIMTGTGDTFCAAADPEDSAKAAIAAGGVLQFLHGLYEQAYRLQINQLDLPVPVIAAVNGPATWHADVPLLSDIVICTEDTYFQDAPHFPQNLVPGDGVHVLWPALLGPNLGRYFLLTGMKLTAKEAYQRGVVQELHPRAQLLPRAWELARAITRHSDSMLRATRAVLVQKLRRDMLDFLPNGLSKELIAALYGVATSTHPSRATPEDISRRE
jgi:enoyl-CoA hydratase/carnithine racemase